MQTRTFWQVSHRKLCLRQSQKFVLQIIEFDIVGGVEGEIWANEVGANQQIPGR